MHEITQQEENQTDGVGIPEPVRAAFPLISDDGPQAHRCQRIEQKYLEVDFHRRVFREEHGREDEPAKADEEQQHEVEAPEALVHHQFGYRYRKDDERYDEGAGGGTQRKLLLGGVVEHRDDDFRCPHEGNAIADCGRFEVFHQVEGQELLFAHVGGSVGQHAQQQVVAAFRPRVILRALMSEFAERGTAVFPLEGCLHRAENHVARLRRAIIIEDVVAVFAILGLVVYLDGFGEANLLFGWDIELLLDDSPSLVGISLTEVVVGLNPHEVIRPAQDEPRHEERLAHVEDAVVHGDIDSPLGVHIVNGRMSVEAIRLLPGLACEQRDADGGVDAECLLGREADVGIHICSTARKEQQNAEKRS